MKAAGAIFLLFVSSAFAGAQRGPASPSPDNLGLTCTQMLAMSSADWVAKFNAAKGADSAAAVRAIAAYGKCYDARTDRLAASLGRSGKGPLMGARGDFQDLDKAIKAFAAKALAGSQPPADALKKAYANLYEKQFRYEFYESYEPKTAAAPSAKVEGKPNVVQPGASAAASAENLGGSSANDAAAAAETKAANDQAERQKSDADPITQAKNHFGELIGDLPDAQVHALHSAFAEILGPNAASPRMQLLVYRYAIYLLEPAGGAPFSPPPF